MRKELFYNPKLLIERLGEYFAEKRRMSRLKNTKAAHLHSGLIDSLELLEMLKSENIEVIYDVGANVGTWFLLADAVLSARHIEAFEPIRQFYELYEKNLSGTTSARLHKFALGTEKRQAVINFASDSSSLLELGTLQKEYFGTEKKSELTIDVVRLDDYAAELNLPKPDLIKLDIQGYELEALKGATVLLKTCRYIICEVSFVEFYVGQPLFHEIASFLAEHNFFTTAFQVNTHLGKKLYQTDVLFEKREKYKKD